jgi:hypothetical protein
MTVSDWIPTAVGIAGIGLLFAGCFMMVWWFAQVPGRWKAPMAARDMYGHAWPLTGVSGMFLLSLSVVIDGKVSLLRILGLIVWGSRTVAAAVAYVRLRRARRQP